MEVRFNNACSLLAVHLENVSVHLVAWPRKLTLLTGKNRERHTVHAWIWGRATEPYDMCLEYFGLGPLGFVCWEPK